MKTYFSRNVVTCILQNKRIYSNSEKSYWIFEQDIYLEHISFKFFLIFFITFSSSSNMDSGWTTVRYGRRRRNHSPAIREPPHRSPDDAPSWGPRHHRRPSPPRRPVHQDWYRPYDPRHDSRPQRRPFTGQRSAPNRYQPQPVGHQRQRREMVRPRTRQRHPLQRGQPG